MRTLLVVLLALMLPWSAFASPERVAVGAADNDLSVQLISADDSRTVLRIDIGGFYREPVTIGTETYYGLGLPEEALLLQRGEPALPRICRSLIISDQGTPEVKIVSAEYTDYPDFPIVPSKGNLLRTVDPETVPYEFGPVYSGDAWYPTDLATVREPFILRDYRGTVLEVNAFQYQPQSRTLRVYHSVIVEVSTNGIGGVNTFDQPKERRTVMPDFEQIYRDRFVNYQTAEDKYTPVAEEGDMLIISYAGFLDALAPLVEWKQQKGIKTTLVNVSTIGNTSTAIKSYIQNLYNTTNLGWVLLVGDAAQGATPTASGGSSDPSYVKLAGGDSYPDAIIGRFSTETVAQVETQVARTITYEKTPVGSDWFHMGTGIGSAEGSGQGHYGEADYVHIGYIRTDLLDFTYTSIDQIYDPGASAAQVTAALNAGRSIINYCGHGSTTSWSTTGFSNSNVTALTNDNMLPFIFSVACVNGQFNGYTCFGEAWLRATHNGNPIGAIGAYMSSINQSWVPPMHAQDEFCDLLCAETMTTYGGICFNGSCKMIDLSGADGIEMYDTWHIFGDPSVQVRTDNPAAITVNHGSVILIGSATAAVEVVGVEGALCALYRDGVIYGTAYTGADGMAVIPLEGELPVGLDLTLTVTGFNLMTYTAPITVITPQGPYVLYDDNTIDDASGNDNGVIDGGETVVLGIQVENVGPDDAVDASGQLTTTDSYVTIVDGAVDFGTIAGNNGTAQVADAFSFTALATIPDGHIIPFSLLVTDAADSSWTSTFTLTAHTPAVEYVAAVVADQGGNNNAVLDPGETVSVMITLRNNGSGQADEIVGILAEEDGYVTIGDAGGTFGTIAAGGGTAGNEADEFGISADASCPRGHQVSFTVTLSGARGYSSTVTFNLVVGDRVPFFTDDFAFNQGWTGIGGSGEWTIGAATGGAGSDTYGGPDPAQDHTATSANGVLGNDLTSGTGGDYAGSLSTTFWVTSPIIDCSDFNGVILSFWRWLGIERNSYDHATIQGFDGTSWVNIYANGASDLNETAWGLQEYDVSAIADSNPNFQVRYGIGSTDGSGNFCGWNIDDLALKGYGELTSGQMALLDEALADSLIPGATVTALIHLANLGGTGSLRVRFAPSVSWIACSTDPQYVSIGDTLAFPITIMTGELSSGDFSGQVSLSTNDPIRPYDTVMVYLHLYAPVMAIAADSISATVAVGETTSQPLIIANDGPGRLSYSVACYMFDGGKRAAELVETPAPAGMRPADGDKSDAVEPYYNDAVRGMGGPDGFGYGWVDSDQSGGPVFSWIDISAVGTAVTMIDDTAMGPYPIGFDFPFYENSYTELYIGSNGNLMFGSGSKVRVNTNLPVSTVPNNQIAIWWDDLDPVHAGAVYYYYDAVGQRFIVSYNGVPNYANPSGTGSLSFQAILYPNGRIVLQYGTMDPGADADGLSGATVGLENAAGTVGLPVVYNAAYIHNDMAIVLAAPRWMTVTPGTGTVEPYSADTIIVGFDPGELTDGVYHGQVTVTGNDPVNTIRTIPATMTIQSYVCGDASGDQTVTVADAVYIIGYVFRAGPAPAPMAAGDANGDGQVNVADAIYIINFVFRSGAAPVCP